MRESKFEAIKKFILEQEKTIKRSNTGLLMFFRSLKGKIRLLEAIEMREWIPAESYDGNSKNSQDMLGYSERWKDPYFNPRGIRLCCKGFGGRWHSTYWEGQSDSYTNDDTTEPEYIHFLPEPHTITIKAN